MAIGDRIRFAIVSDGPSQRSIVLLHRVVTAETAAGATVQEMANDLDAAHAASWKAMLPDDVTYRGIRAQKYFPLPPALPFSGVGGAGLGTVVDDVLGPQVCGAITWRTQAAGRAFRGRSYIPFPPKVAGTAAMRPTGAYQAFIGIWAGVWLPQRITVGAAGTSTTKLVLQSRKTLATITDITAFLVRNYWTTQRRRSDVQRPDLIGPI